MTMDEHLAELVRAAVAEAMVPVTEALVRLKAETEERGCTYQEAAEKLRVTKKTIQRLVRSGELPTVPGIHPPRVLLSEVLRLAVKRAA